MIHSSEFHELNPSERFFSLARAYLEASIVLCEAMIDKKYRTRFANSRVILHLCHHAIELFLKAAIMTKTSEALPANTHNLHDLYKRYQEMFEGLQFRISMPFDLEAIPPLKLSPEMTVRYFGQLDERYRYTLDKKLASFSGIEGFLPDSFYEQLQEHCREFDRLMPLITTHAATGSRDRGPE